MMPLNIARLMNLLVKVDTYVQMFYSSGQHDEKYNDFDLFILFYFILCHFILFYFMKQNFHSSFLFK